MSQLIPTGQNVFVIDLEYLVPFAEVELHLDAHMEFIKDCLDRGFIIMAGRKVPRSGGMIIATAPSREEAEATMARDPFVIEGVAAVSITEMVAGTRHRELN